MLDPDQINRIVREVATASLTPGNVRAVVSEPWVASDGHDAVRITIVIAPGIAPTISGDAVLDTMLGIQDRLREAGEERFPIVGYAAEDELATSGDTEP